MRALDLVRMQLAMSAHTMCALIVRLFCYFLFLVPCKEFCYVVRFLSIWLISLPNTCLFVSLLPFPHPFARSGVDDGRELLYDDGATQLV